MRCLFLLIPVLFGTPASAEPASRKTTEAYRLAGETVVLDGVLDEAVWAKAPVSSGFVERSPTAGAKPPADTRMRLLYDDEALVIGLEMGLVPDEIPVGRTLAREATQLWSDDAVTVKLDVHFEHRNLVGFAVNVAGATIDFVALENGRIFRTEFDAVWEAKTSVRTDAWVAEMRIPYAAMGLPKRAGPQTLGLNVARDHNRRRATDDWSAIPKGFGAGSAIHCGQVTLNDVGAPTTLSILPSLTIKAPGETALVSSGPVGFSAGTDLRLRLGEDVWGELTFLTDFAEVDLDAAVLNFSRFPLFLPEKRQFFLTGLDVFTFGRPRNTQLFFSRRIGLDDDNNEVPILGGGKIYGRAGKLAFGALQVITGETDGAPATSFSVARAYREMGALRLGSIVAMRTRFDPRPAPPPETMMTPPPGMMGTMPPPMMPSASSTDEAARIDHLAAGVDGTLRLADNRLEMSSFAGTTFDLRPVFGQPDAPARRGHTGAFDARWRGAVFRPHLTVSTTDADFAPQMGFVRRTDITHGRGNLEWDWRWQKGFIERVNYVIYGGGARTMNLDRGLGHSIGSGIELTTRQGLDLEMGVEHLVDVVTESFELFGFVVPAGNRERNGAYVVFGTASQRNPRLNLFANGAIGPDEDGDWRMGGSVTVNLGAHLRLDARLAWTRVILLHEAPSDMTPAPDGAPRLVNLDSLQGNAGLVLAASPDLSADIVLQGTTTTREDETLAPMGDFAGTALLRIRWRYLPGSDLFVVYRHPFDLHRGDRADGPLLTLKLSYWYDLGL